MAKPTAGIRLRDRIGSITSGTVAWIYAALLILPFYYFVVSSFKDNDGIFESPLALPASWDLSNFTEAIRQASLGPAIANSAITTVAALVLTLVLALPASFALARATGRAGRIVEGCSRSGSSSRRSRRCSRRSSSPRAWGSSTPGRSSCSCCPRPRCPWPS